MELEWKPLALLLLFWALEGGNVWLCLRWPDFAYGALALYVGTCLLCIFASFGLGVPTIPRSRKPWMQALWYLALAGSLPAALAFALLGRDGEMEEPVADFFENVALCLTAMTLLLLWVGAADFVGTLGLQPLAEAGAKSWAPPAFLLASILWIVVVYNLTHVIGSVEASVAQDLPSPYGLGVYVAAVALWLASFAQVLITRPGQPKDFQDSLQHRGGGMCLYCQAQKPQRCRHCTKCGACVLRMDHHCPWLRQCIGYGNYKYFVMFIFYSAVALGFKAVTMMIFILKAFQTEITFCTRLWLVSCEALVLALGVTMIAFASFHLLLVAKGMTTIEFLTRHEKSDKKLTFDQGFFGNVQASLGDFPLFWCFPACPPSGDGRSFNYTVLPQDEQKATKRELSMSSKEKEMQQSLNVPKAEANLSRGQPCLETTAEPTCIEQQQDGCVAAAEEDV